MSQDRLNCLSRMSMTIESNLLNETDFSDMINTVPSLNIE